ncbi:MAG TPA: DNA repair protein RecN [Rickettsiales bacterium]|nr:DNA repair protein RecN [Rickettsiales bacterium]
MLESLSINNIVLIDNLNLQLSKGLCVLTGETGSGKSILLDALGLAIGYRSNSRLLRSGEEKGSVIAVFNITNNQKCKDRLKELDIEFDDNIIIRRILFNDGKSKAFINDVQVTQSFLENVGNTLLEIHGQNEQIGLLNSSMHREILDEFGGLVGKQMVVAGIFEKMKTAKEKLNELITQKDNIEKEQDYLKHIINEIEVLNLKQDEEQELSDKRNLMMNKEKVLNVLNDVKNSLEGQNSVEKGILSAQHTLSRGVGLGNNLFEEGKNAFEEIIEYLYKANESISEATYKIDKIFDNLGFDGESLESVEERLFAIRGLARKLNVQPNMLLDLKVELDKKLEILENQDVFMADLQKELNGLRTQFLQEAKELSELRKQTAKRLAQELMLELAPLKMEKTVFDTEFKELNEDNWNRYGIDSIRFIASTNPGMPMNELSKIASGGELSRFMLALKVVLSQVNSVPTMIFDEIDTGISGAVAEAVGDRLKKLGQNLQVLVVTHHAQVASKGNYHLKVKKEQQTDKTTTMVDVLGGDDRVKEVARMFSGEVITDEALRVAEKMIKI